MFLLELSLQEIGIGMRCLLVMHIWTMSPDLSQGIEIPHHAQDSLSVDIPAFRPQYPLTDTAEAVSEFAFCLRLLNRCVVATRMRLFTGLQE